MMKGDEMNTPAASLSCLQSLSDILLELPLPTFSYAAQKRSRSLLSHLKDPKEALRFLNTKDSLIVLPLLKAISNANVDHIEVKSKFCKSSHPRKISVLGQHLLRNNLGLFKDKISVNQDISLNKNAPQSSSAPQSSNVSISVQKRKLNTCSVSSQCIEDNENIDPVSLSVAPKKAKIVQNSNGNASPNLITKALSCNAIPPKQECTLPLSRTSNLDDTDVSCSSASQPNSQIFSSAQNSLSDCEALTVLNSLDNDISMCEENIDAASLAENCEIPFKEALSSLLNVSEQKENSETLKNANYIPESVSDKKVKLCSQEVVIPLSKLSLEDQLLAERSVEEFMLKNVRSDLKSKHPVQNKISSHGSRKFAQKRKFNVLSEDKTDNETHFKKRKKKIITVDLLSSEGDDDNSVNHNLNQQSHENSTQFTADGNLKFKKKKRINIDDISVENIMDSDVYQLFSRRVDAIFDCLENVDFLNIDEEVNIAEEFLIPIAQLQELRDETAKLKRLHAMHLFPPQRLTKLIIILHHNIVDGAKITLFKECEEQDDDDEEETSLMTERVMRSVEATLSVLYMMTSSNMPQNVLIEDAIERIVHFLKYQLQNTIFPLFDSIYRTDSKSKDGYARNTKQRKNRKVQEKSAFRFYNKFNEAVTLLGELLELQTLPDSIILDVSALGVSPFFVEEVSELQLNALHLVSTVFSRYDKHRTLILEDILSSIARLPSGKRNLRNYRLNSQENIQMLTALVLQLIHSVINLPEPNQDSNLEIMVSTGEKETSHIEKDVLITSYEAAIKAAINFLSAFLKKCGSKNEEMDYRPLFENFVHDLLSTVNKPEWPASVLLLSLLGRMLVANFSDKTVEMALRVASLDYLGVVASHLRKMDLRSRNQMDMINDIIQRLISQNENSYFNSTESNTLTIEDNIKVLQEALLQYLDSRAENDPSLCFPRRFYIAQWYKETVVEIEQLDKSLCFLKTKSSKQVLYRKKSGTISKFRKLPQVNYEKTEDRESNVVSDVINHKVLATAEDRKRFYLSLYKGRNVGKISLKKQDHIDSETAELICQYLAFTRHFSQNFDSYLNQILCVLSETSIAIRTKAMKCLTLVVEADPNILACENMKKGVHGRLLDQSCSVREAAIDLLGRFILHQPELIDQYYEMLTDRILDTSVSVRKRVINILKDICLKYPNFPKIPDICVKIIRRVNDEDGIRKLVGNVFQNMWLSPVSKEGPNLIHQRVKHIVFVVEACRETGLECLEQLLSNFLKNKDDSNYKLVLKSYMQIVDCLIEKILQLEESMKNVEEDTNMNLLPYMETLYLFCKIKPMTVVPHATTIQPYLSMKCNSKSDLLLLKNVIRTIEIIVPLIDHPSDSFLAQIEEDIVKLILKQYMLLLQSCISCLSTLVNKITQNYQLVKDCFQKFLVVIVFFKKQSVKNILNTSLDLGRPNLLKSLVTVGLFCRYFDFPILEPTSESNNKLAFKEIVFENVSYFNQYPDDAIKLKALASLGFMFIKHYEFMLGPEVKKLYDHILTSSDASSSLKCQVLRNIANYLQEEELQTIQRDAEWNKISKFENLKEMDEIHSGMSSTIIQVYLKHILECILNEDVLVRKATLAILQNILKQGLIHPAQILPYLICLSSDDDSVIRTSCDQLLQDIQKKYPIFIPMKALYGVRMSFKMQNRIQNSGEILRGFRYSKQTSPASCFSSLYFILRSSRQYRRGFLLSLLNLFEEQVGTPLKELLYIADNIAHFPYLNQDEPLFVMHHLDIKLSVFGSNLLQTFNESLVNRGPSNQNEIDMTPEKINDENDDADLDQFQQIISRLPDDLTIFQDFITATQEFILLLYIKQFFKEIYGLTDNKLQQYSPSENAKVYERPLSRKSNALFNPETVLNFLRNGESVNIADDEGKSKLVSHYLYFKQLMLSVDPSNDDEEEGDEKGSSFLSKSLCSLNASILIEETSIHENDCEIRSAQTIKNPAFKPSSSGSCRQSLKTSKVNSKKKHKRRRIIELASDDSDNDPDFVCKDIK